MIGTQEMKKITIHFFTILLNLAFSCAALALTVGVTAGPHEFIMEEVQKDLSQLVIPLKIVKFNDFILPNLALDSGDIDINSYQHQPFLDEQVRTRGYQIQSIAKTITLPLGIYSKKYQSLSNLSEKSKIAIPNDPTNGARALLLLKKIGLLELKSEINPSVLDISKNLKNIKLIELESPQLPRSLEDVDFAIINTDWILVAGLNPKDALAKEEQNSPYANVLAIKRGNENRKDIQTFISVYQTKKNRDFIQSKFQGAILPAW